MQQPASVQCKILLQRNTNKISTPFISLKMQVHMDDNYNVPEIIK